MNNYICKPASSVEIINKVKDSKFIANIACVDSKKSAEIFVKKISKKYHDATHNVVAYKIGSGDEAIKYANDDGEPARSSGPPILQAIEGRDISNIVIVVSRYFGGTKLGIGGLIRAYGDTAKMVMEKAGKKKSVLYFKIMASGNYDQIGIIMAQIESYNGKILSTVYNSNGGKITFIINPEIFIKLKESLIEDTGNKVKFTKISQSYY